MIASSAVRIVAVARPWLARSSRSARRRERSLPIHSAIRRTRLMARSLNGSVRGVRLENASVPDGRPSTRIGTPT